jgi:hypothetical protein
MSIFENIWLLLTVAGIMLVVVAVVRQAKPEWGHWLLLIPLAIVGLAFGLDAMIQTDTEAINELFSTCKKAVINNNPQALMACISPNYSDHSRRSKADLEAAVRRELNRMSIKKVKIQSSVLTITGKTAQSELDVVVHFDQNNSYDQLGTLVFLGLELQYEKIGKKWFISNIAVVSVNDQPWDW